jgi:hypothetical protein
MSKKLVVNRIGAATHKDHSLPPFWTPFSLFVTKKSDGERSAAGDGVSSGQGDAKSAMSQCQKIVAKNAPLVCSVFIRFCRSK